MEKEGIKLGYNIPNLVSNLGLVSALDSILTRLSMASHKLSYCSCILLLLLLESLLALLLEPFTEQCLLLIKDIFKTLLKIKEEGTTILIVEQNALATLKIADYAYVLELGKISMHGKASELLKDERLIEAYLGGK